MPRKKNPTPQPRGNPTHMARWHPITRRITLDDANAQHLHTLAPTKDAAQALVNQIVQQWLREQTAQA